MIFTKLGVGEDVPGLHPRAKLNLCGFKSLGLQPPKSPKLVIFAINFPQMDYPLTRFFLQN